MYEIRTQAELLLFYQYASEHPTVWDSLENVKIQHTKLGSGTIVAYEPATDSRSDPKIRVRFDAPAVDAAPKRLALPSLFEKGLLRSLALPPTVGEPFRKFAVQQAQQREAPPRQTPALPPRNKDWRAFQEIVRAQRLSSLYHFTDSRNLPSIRKYGGLFSWWQCKERGIKVTAFGSDSESRQRDRKYNLEDYVRLSFNPYQPMMYWALKAGRIRNVKILRIDPTVIYLEPTRFTDVNANDTDARVGGSLKSFEQVRFDIATGSYWIGWSEKRLFQAEVLVKSHVPLRLIKVL